MSKSAPPEFSFAPEDFPVTITAHRASTGIEIWRKTMDKAGQLYVPPLALQIGEPVFIRLKFGDGTALEFRDGTQ